MAIDCGQGFGDLGCGQLSQGEVHLVCPTHEECLQMGFPRLTCSKNSRECMVPLRLVGSALVLGDRVLVALLLLVNQKKKKQEKKTPWTPAQCLYVP